MNLFQEEHGKVSLTTEAKAIKEFRFLWTRDKNQEKHKAFADIAFVYFFSDFQSPYVRYSESERMDILKKDLYYKPHWKLDKHVLAAIDRYKELQETPAVRALATIRESLMTSTRVIALLKTQVEDMLNSPSGSDQEEEDSMDMSTLITNIQQLLDLSKKLPGAITSIEELEDKVKKEQSGGRKIKGGGKENYFEEG